MFGMFRNIRNKIIGRGHMHMPGRSGVENDQGQAGGVQSPMDQNINFAHKFDATDEELAKVSDLNDSDLYSDGSSKYSRTDVHRHDGGDTESLNYPHAPNLKGKGSRAA